MPSWRMASPHVVRPPLPDDPLAATGRPLRWGVVATGSIARTVSAQLRQLEDAELHAIASRDLDRARALAAERGAPVAYGDGARGSGVAQLAADPDVDVVYVATPHGHHHDVTVPLLEAGKHVLVEKAFTVNAAEAEALVALAAARGVFLMEAVWTRFLPAYVRALDVLVSGELGEVRWVQADLGFAAAADPRSRLWAPEDGGGALLDLGVYTFTWAHAALGMPASVQAVGHRSAQGVDAGHALTLTYPGGAVAQLLGSLEAHATRTATIAGSRGVLRTFAPLTHPEGFMVMTGDDRRREEVPHGPVPYAYMLREVTRCVQQGLGESPTMPLADTVATLRLFDAARAQLGVAYPNDRQA
ncbi:MAG: Gfo/Idh/MocA family oxidoreductase [Trueperaceae bacterium]|nr:Gfo/Idh/MocA family oxidoreductase [Trueperaceae bacterium]